jgi:hypothetical protein
MTLITIQSALRAMAAVAALLGAAPSFGATSFYFDFDDSGFATSRGEISQPLVGSGEFTTSADLMAGTYALPSLPDFALSFRFVDEREFTQADIATPIEQVAIRITDVGAGRLRLQFTENGTPANGGPDSGALDLVRETSLSFEPSFVGGNDRYFSSRFLGNYLALNAAPVPEPETWAMAILGLGLVGAAARHARRERVQLA